MRLGFSTLGCSGEALEAVTALARSTGWVGLELRAGDDEPVHVGIGLDERRRARRLLDDAGVAAISIASYVRVADTTADDDAVVADLLAHAHLARDLGAPYVRVFPGGTPDRPGDDVAAARLRDAVMSLDDVDVDVVLALETHDSHPRGADVARVLERVAHDRVTAIWDALHPWRAGEPVADTAAALGDRLAYVQIKDVASAHDPSPVLPGTGALPLAEIVGAALAADQARWVSLEWEAKWFPAASPLHEAIAAADELVSSWGACPSPGRRRR